MIHIANENSKATQIAKAYIQIIPTTQGIKASLTTAMDDAGDEAGKSAGKKSGSSFLSSAGSAIAKGAAAVGAAAATAITAAVKQSVESYGEYEQLVGGAQLMFGDAFETVAENAKNAYATVQLSQNDYLQQVNGFATGLKTTLGGNEQAAAELAHKIVTAEADVVAATGNSREAVENAFNGIMRSNYTMLDNLQLGITPTEKGFQSLIDSVNEWNAENGRMTEYTIDNVADCQSALIDYIEMQGLSGYAANEAADTIQGSAASMKAAWENMVVAIADENADFDGSVSALTDSVAAFAENLLPRVKTALSGISKVVREVAPDIVAALPGLINDVLPDLLDAALDVIKAVAEFLPGSLRDIISTVVSFFIDNIPEIVQTGIELFCALVQDLPVVIDEIVFVAIPQIIKATVSTLLENLPLLAETGLELLMGLLTNLNELQARMQEAAGQMVSSFVEGFNSWWDDILAIGDNIVAGIWQGIQNAYWGFVSNVRGFFSGIVAAVKGDLEIGSPSKVFAEIGGFMADGLGVGFADGMADVRRDVLSDVNRVVGSVSGMSVNSILTASPVESDTFVINVDAKNVKEFNDLVRIAQNARFNARMGVA